MTRTILWDMDGTLADTEEAHFLAWQVSLKQYGVAYAYDDFIADFGRSNRQLLPEVLGVAESDPLIDQVSHEKEANFRRICRERSVLPLPGVVEWLDRFRTMGIQQVVSSSGPMANIVTLTELLDVGDYFLALMSGAALPRSKPDPTIFLNSAAAVDAQPAECIVIEDSVHGIEGAWRAGMSSVAVGNIAASADLVHLLESHSHHKCAPVERLDLMMWEKYVELWSQE